MVDPRYFKQESGVGQWVDAMVRVRGPVVEGLAVTFLEDWELDTGEGLDKTPQDERRTSARGSGGCSGSSGTLGTGYR